MAYQRDDNFWYSSTKIDNKSKIDFYSQLKKKHNFVETGEFYSTQGMNISEFRNDFIMRHENKISPEFKKVLIELGIKNWIRQSFANSSAGLPITSQSLLEKQFFTIYVRSPKNETPKAVAVEFLYKEGSVFIINILRDLRQIRRKFRFLKTTRDSDKLINDQQYYVDEKKQLYISCYTDNTYTPILIGRNGILEDMEIGTLEISRGNQNENSRLLPLVSYYNERFTPFNRIQNVICIDLQNKDFIQY